LNEPKSLVLSRERYCSSLEIGCKDLRAVSEVSEVRFAMMMTLRRRREREEEERNSKDENSKTVAGGVRSYLSQI